MKVKIYQYGKYPRHNQIVNRQMEIEQLDESVYICVAETHDSNSDYDILSVVVNIGERFFEIDQCSRQLIAKPKNIEFIKNIVSDYESHVMGKIAKNQHVSIMDMTILETLGKDTAPLIEHRRKKEEERTAEYEEEKRQAEAQKQRVADAEQERLVKIKEEYVSGEKISGKDFASICRKDGMDVHIRTIGTLNKSISELNRHEIIYVWKQRGKARPNTDGVRKLIKEYNVYLSQKQQPINPEYGQ